MFDESKHPREKNGKFTDGSGTYDSKDDFGSLKRKVTSKLGSSKGKPVKIDMDAEVQKQLDKATPKERQKIAYRYIMDNLRGKYPAEDGRIIAIEKVGADKMSHTLNETKIRVVPELANLIKAGEFEGVVEAAKEGSTPHKIFSSFAYYKVPFQIGDTTYVGLLNVGIRKDGSSTLYDLNPFEKQ